MENKIFDGRGNFLLKYYDWNCLYIFVSEKRYWREIGVDDLMFSHSFPKHFYCGKLNDSDACARNGGELDILLLLWWWIVVVDFVIPLMLMWDKTSKLSNWYRRWMIIAIILCLLDMKRSPKRRFHDLHVFMLYFDILFVDIWINGMNG